MVKEHTREELFISLNEVEPASWIIEGLALEQGLTILFGGKGAGKTTLSMQILHALLAKEKFLVFKTKQVGAFIVEQDEPPRIFRNHRDRVLGELPQLKDMEIPRVFVTWDSKKGEFTNLRDLIKAYPAKLVIIDSFTSLGIPDLNHPSTSVVLDRLRQINSELECSFILLHHVNKAGDILGSVTLQIKADNLIELNGQGLKFHKTRGELKSITGDILPIARAKPSILFKLTMAQRAKMLLDDPDARDILRQEYPESSDDSRRVTLSKATRKSKEVVMSLAS